MLPEFKDYDELINILKNKGFNIKDVNDVKRVKKVLEKESYYNVVNGYKDLFLNTDSTHNPKKDIVKENTDFFEMKALYDFDRELRIIFLKYILLIENNFKSALSHEFSKLYGCDNYLKLDNFDSSTTEKISEIISLFGDIQQEIARQMNKNNSMITHYMSDYGFIPLWVLVNALTLGKVTTFYLHMKDNDKTIISRRFGLHFRELHKYMSMLGIARNKCAHDERFYNLKFTQNIHTKSIPYFRKIGIPTDDDNNYIMGINDVFAITIIFKQMLSKYNFHEFMGSLKSQFSKLNRSLKTISLQDVQNEMGFIENWAIIQRL